MGAVISPPPPPPAAVTFKFGRQSVRVEPAPVPPRSLFKFERKRVRVEPAPSPSRCPPPPLEPCPAPGPTVDIDRLCRCCRGRTSSPPAWPSGGCAWTASRTWPTCWWCSCSATWSSTSCTSPSSALPSRPVLPLRGTGNKAIPLRQLVVRHFNTNIPPGLRLFVLLFAYHVNEGIFSTAWVSWLACTSILNAPVLYNPFPTFPDWMEEGEYFSGRLAARRSSFRHRTHSSSRSVPRMAPSPGPWRFFGQRSGWPSKWRAGPVSSTRCRAVW